MTLNLNEEIQYIRNVQSQLHFMLKTVNGNVITIEYENSTVDISISEAGFTINDKTYETFESLMMNHFKSF